MHVWCRGGGGSWLGGCMCVWLIGDEAGACAVGRRAYGVLTILIATELGEGLVEALGICRGVVRRACLSASIVQLHGGSETAGEE